MKRWIGLVLSLMIVFTAFAGTASAASASPAVKVKLNGDWVIFPTPPVILKGKTFVEFRTLFTQLGYAIDYDAKTKTIKAKSSSRSIQMTPTGTTALVDGAKVPVNGEMQLLNGRTMVGVRFIATLSDKDVGWDGVKKIVTIGDRKPTAAQQAEVFAVLNGLAAAEDKQDADAFLALFHSTSPLKDVLGDYIREQFAKFHIQTKYADMSLESYSAKEAIVSTLEDSKKLSGTGFYADVENEVLYTLRKEANGKWKIYGLEMESTEILDENSLWAQEVQAPDADKTALTALVNAQVAAINTADLNAYQATLMPNADGYDDDVAELKDMFDDSDYTLKATLVRSAVVELNENSAIVLVAFRYDVQSKADDNSTAFRSVTEYHMTKKDGKWYVLPGSNANELVGERIDS